MDGDWFHIFLSLHCNASIFKRLFTRSKKREEIELSQGTPEVQKNLRNWKYSANEITRINNWTNQKRGFKEFSSGCSVNSQSARYGGAIAVFTYVCGTTEVHKQGTLEVHLHPGSALLCTWNSVCLIFTSREPCCSSISTLFLLLVNKQKNPTAVMEEQKIVKPLAFY